MAQDNGNFERGPSSPIEYIQRDIAEINKKLDDKYVTKDQFEPIKNLVYGFVALVLVGVIGAILDLVINHTK